MGRPLIGQVLSRMGKLSPMDIEEILAEQATNRHRFGEIALSWGLCQPQDLCDAFCAQVTADEHGVDLHEFGIDARAARFIPADLARRMHLIPLRTIGDQLVVAISRRMDSVEMAELSRATGRDVRLLQANPSEIDRAIDKYYPPEAA